METILQNYPSEKIFNSDIPSSRRLFTKNDSTKNNSIKNDINKNIIDKNIFTNNAIDKEQTTFQSNKMPIPESKLVNINSPGLLATSPMVALNLLDSSEVKNDKCPTCKTSYHLTHSKGFRICPYCHSIYKIWNGLGYKVMLTNKDEQMSVNEMVLRNIGMNRLFD